jgi:glycosyltransferase involved in cell wall biosynthesis
VDVEIYCRSGEDHPRHLMGRLRAGLGALYSPSSVRRFSRVVDSFKPDIVHIHDLFPLISPWIAEECQKRGIPVVMTCVHYRLTCPIATHFRRGQVCTSCTGGREHWAVLHNCRGNLPESITVALHNAITSRFRVYARHVDRFIAPSRFTRDWLVEHTDITAEKIAVISPVVEIPPSGADPGAGTYVAFAGRFVPEKGVDTVLEAARLTGIPFRFSRNERHLTTFPLPPHIEAVVTRNEEELRGFYRGARMTVVPSVWFETFGLVGAEAMSHGIPLIASRIGALTELVDDGVDGLLFEPRNAADLADKVARLWEDIGACRRMGREARRKALSQWSPDEHFVRLAAVYESVSRGGLKVLSPLSTDAQVG